MFSSCATMRAASMQTTFVTTTTTAAMAATRKTVTLSVAVGKEEVELSQIPVRETTLVESADVGINSNAAVDNVSPGCI